MKIIAYQCPIDVICPASQLRLVNHWARAWAKTGLEPFVATEWHLGSDALSKWLLEAFMAQERPTPAAVLMQTARAIAPAVLRKGEYAYVTSVDLFPTQDNGWHREEPENLLIWKDGTDEVMAFGTRGQLIDYVASECEPTPLSFVSLTVERTNILCPPVTWPTDEPIEEPPTGQFGGQFRPRTRIPK